MKRKVLLVATKTSGGAAQACLMQLAALNTPESSFQATLLTLYPPPTPISNVASVLDSDEPKLSFSRKIQNALFARTTRLLSRPGLDGVQVPFGQYDISRHPLFRNADIIVFHWCYNFVDFSKLRGHRKKYFWVLHDLTPLNGGIPYEFPGDDSLVYRLYRKFIRKKLSHNLLGTDVCYVGPSVWMYEKAKHLHGQEHAWHLPNATEIEVFSSSVTKSSQTNRSICFVAAEVENKRKGMDLLIEAIKLIHEPLTIYVIGSFTKSFEETIPQNHKFIHLGFIDSRQQLAEAYSKAGIFVIPSRMDNLPNTILESLVSGLPVIGFAVGGIPELIEHDENGIIVKDTNPSSLAHAIELACEKTWDRKLIQTRAISRFSYKAHLRAFESMINSKD